MTRPTDNRLAEIQQRVDKATVGPWATDGPWWWDDDANGEPTCGEMVTTRADRSVVAIMLPAQSKLGTGNENANATFIARSRADMDWLLAEVVSLRGKLATATDIHHQVGPLGHPPKNGEDTYCAEEGSPWPCGTAAALGERR